MLLIQPAFDITAFEPKLFLQHLRHFARVRLLAFNGADDRTAQRARPAGDDAEQAFGRVGDRKRAWMNVLIRP